MPVTRGPSGRPAAPAAAPTHHRRSEAASSKAPGARKPRTVPTPPAQPPTLIELPDVRQATGYTCGTASLLSILSYYGWKGGDPNEKDLARRLGTTSQNGTEPGAIARVSNRLGVKAEVKEGMTLDDIAVHLKHGRPVMVAYQAYPDASSKYPDQQPWSADWGDGHWSIIIGMDANNVYLEDPSMLGKRGFIPKAEFVERWHDTDDKNRPCYQQLGIVFDSKTPASLRNPVTVRRFEYVP